MALDGYYVQRTTRKQITAFIEQWHYSGSINGCIADYCYSVHCPSGDMVGAMFFGRMAMAGQWKRFGESAEVVIELRRLCCIDDTPRNLESFFISRCLRMLRRDWCRGVVVSYADKEYGHTGVIYRASNFQMVGEVAGARVILHNGKRYHDKAIRTKYRGVLKPFAVRLRAALATGEARYVDTAGKYTYVYRL